MHLLQQLVNDLEMLVQQKNSGRPGQNGYLVGQRDVDQALLNLMKAIVAHLTPPPAADEQSSEG